LTTVLFFQIAASFFSLSFLPPPKLVFFAPSPGASFFPDVKVLQLQSLSSPYIRLLGAPFEFQVFPCWEKVVPSILSSLFGLSHWDQPPVGIPWNFTRLRPGLTFLFGHDSVFPSTLIDLLYPVQGTDTVVAPVWRFFAARSIFPPSPFCFLPPMTQHPFAGPVNVLPSFARRFLSLPQSRLVSRKKTFPYPVARGDNSVFPHRFPKPQERGSPPFPPAFGCFRSGGACDPHEWSFTSTPHFFLSIFDRIREVFLLLSQPFPFCFLLPLKTFVTHRLPPPLLGR